MISHEHKFIFVHINKTGGTSVERVLRKISKNWNGKHHSIEQYKCLANKKHGFEKYFKFTFVRNSWERFLSLYKYRVMMDTTSLKTNPVSFKEWAIEIRDKDPFYYTATNEMKALMLSPQLEWITDKKENIAVDFIGRFENFQEDFNVVCDKIGCLRQELPHINKTKHEHYAEYYDDETREIVAEKYAKDIEYFGYRFGD